MSFKVQARQCATCIYRADSLLNVARLEAEIADSYGGFTNYRVCHHSEDVCCRGFWNRHRDAFQLGQLAQRLQCVEFVQIDMLKRS